MWSPVRWLVVLTALFAVDAGVLTFYGEDLSPTTEALWALAFALFLAWWVYSDRRARGFSAPFEFDAFVVFAWPVVVPYYLFRTRGRVGLALGASVWLLYLIPTLVAWSVYLAFGE
jgi:hypothetical protein